MTHDRCYLIAGHMNWFRGVPQILLKVCLKIGGSKVEA